MAGISYIKGAYFIRTARLLVNLNWMNECFYFRVIKNCLKVSLVLKDAGGRLHHAFCC